ADSEVRAEALTWLAAVLREQHRYAEAAQAAEAASHVSPIFNLAARLERELAVEYEATASHDAPPRMERMTAHLEHATLLYPLGLRPEDPVRSLEGVLRRFGGNRTLHLTTTEDGKLSAYRLPLDPRYLGANVLRVVWTRGPEAARELYRTLAPTVNADPL